MTGEKIKILLVEDEPAIYKDIKRVIEKEGHAVLQAPGKLMVNSYETAVAACQTEIPHMAVLDIDLNGEKDGLDIAAYIRENFFSPVIILSGKYGDAFMRRANIIGVDGYIIKLEKPYDVQQLQFTIKRFLPLAEAAARRRIKSVFLHVKEFQQKIISDEFYMSKRIDWADLKIITTDKAPKNNILLELANGKKYVYRSSLADFKLLLPFDFIQINNFQIINAAYFDAKGKSKWVYSIAGKKYEIAAAYRTDGVAMILNKLFA